MHYTVHNSFAAHVYLMMQKFPFKSETSQTHGGAFAGSALHAFIQESSDIEDTLWQK